MPMTSDRTKDIREWFTLGLSAITALAVPIGLIILRNQRLEILDTVSQKYVPITAYKDDYSRMESTQRSLSASQGELKGQMNTLLIEQVHMSDSLAVLKEKVDQRNKGSGGG